MNQAINDASVAVETSSHELQQQFNQTTTQSSSLLSPLFLPLPCSKKCFQHASARTETTSFKKKWHAPTKLFAVESSFAQLCEKQKNQMDNLTESVHSFSAQTDDNIQASVSKTGDFETSMLTNVCSLSLLFSFALLFPFLSSLPWPLSSFFPQLISFPLMPAPHVTRPTDFDQMENEIDSSDKNRSFFLEDLQAAGAILDKYMKNHQRDVPTGQTPKRKNVIYPTSFPRTKVPQKSLSLPTKRIVFQDVTNQPRTAKSS